MSGGKNSPTILTRARSLSLLPQAEKTVDFLMLLVLAVLVLLSWGLVRLCDKV
jgi:hypothetical protein